MEKKTLVLGASENVERYSNKAVRKLVAYGHPVIAIGKKAGNIDKVKFEVELLAHEKVDTITIYLGEKNQKTLYDYIISLKPKRIIFNPGAENIELEVLAKEKGIETLEACTLVMLSTNQY
jgi:uncharacterized protein